MCWQVHVDEHRHLQMGRGPDGLLESNPARGVAGMAPGRGWANSQLQMSDLEPNEGVQDACWRSMDNCKRVITRTSVVVYRACYGRDAKSWSYSSEIGGRSKKQVQYRHRRHPRSPKAAVQSHSPGRSTHASRRKQAHHPARENPLP